MQGSRRIVLLDGYAHVYRSFYAIRELTNQRGQPVNALYGVARFAASVERDYPHEFGAVAFDKGAPAARLALLPEYKATRPSMPDALAVQLPAIREWLIAAGWPVLEEEGLEADDLIAGIVAVREGRDTYVVSHDKDLAQLVAPGVSLLVPGFKGGLAEMDPAAVQEKFGVAPGQLRDYLALVGDSSDNIPGVPGVGPKTAARLLGEHGSIDGILAQLDAIPSAVLRGKLAAAVEVLRRNRQLVALDQRLPSWWGGLESLRRREPQWDTLLDMARANGFKSLVTALSKARDEARNPTLF